jgi:hypothetical protein
MYSEKNAPNVTKYRPNVENSPNVVTLGQSHSRSSFFCELPWKRISNDNVADLI